MIMSDLDILIKNTYTISSLKNRLRALRAYFSKDFFSSDLNLTEDEKLWIESLPKEFIEKFNKDNISKILGELEKQINQIQFLTIFLPFEADSETIRLIGLKSREHFGPRLVLDIKYDARLIAGCALSWGGIYKDYSLHAKIAERNLAISQSFKKFLI